MTRLSREDPMMLIERLRMRLVDTVNHGYGGRDDEGRELAARALEAAEEMADAIRLAIDDGRATPSDKAALAKFRETVK